MTSLFLIATNEISHQISITILAKKHASEDNNVYKLLLGETLHSGLIVIAVGATTTIQQDWG